MGTAWGDMSGNRPGVQHQQHPGPEISSSGPSPPSSPAPTMHPFKNPTSVDASAFAQSPLQQSGTSTEHGTTAVTPDACSGASEAAVEHTCGDAEVDGDAFDEDAFEEYALDDDFTADSEDRRVDEQEMYSTLELIAEKPKDVVQYLEEEGVSVCGVGGGGVGQWMFFVLQLLNLYNCCNDTITKKDDSIVNNSLAQLQQS